jgi:hypothetical protein
MEGRRGTRRLRARRAPTPARADRDKQVSCSDVGAAHRRDRLYRLRRRTEVQRTLPVMPDADRPRGDALSNVRDWLSKTGFPTELKAERVFKRAGIDTVIGSFYIDPVTKKYRETDVLARLRRTWYPAGPQALKHPHGTLEVVVVGECKTSMKHYVIFSSEAEDLVLPALDRLASPPGRDVLARVVADDRGQALELLRTPDRIGYALAQSFESGDGDSAYVGINQVVDGSLARRVTAFDGGAGVGVARIVFPVLILGGKLFEYWLDDAGAEHLEERTAARLYWRRPAREDAEMTIVDIVTLEALPDFCAAVKELFTYIEGVHDMAVIEACQDPRRPVVLGDDDVER